MKRRLLLVEWQDAASDDGWKPYEDVLSDPLEPHVVHSLGWFVRQTRNLLVIAGDIGRADDTARRMEIPRRMIRKVTTLPH